MIKDSIVLNNLVAEKSPYLLQHANNPVNWNVWNEDIFEKAKQQNKPVFLSIGYSNCKKCYKMQKESFEDMTVSEILNENFIAIKVDKEERPDIATLYTEICKAFSGHTGWPLTIIMTWEKKPFFAGTYFPKEKKDNELGLIDLLNSITKQWNEDRGKLERVANEITIGMRKYQGDIAKSGEINYESVLKALNIIEYFFKQRNEQMKNYYKFIMEPQNILFLIEHYKLKKDEYLLNIIHSTLDKIYLSGVFDYIGFGFFEYVDEEAFSFEKTLYNNSLMAMVFLEGYKITQNEKFKYIATRTLEYMMANLYIPGMGFCYSQSGESQEDEEKYYLFTPEEIINVLGSKEGKKFNKVFDIQQRDGSYMDGLPKLLKLDKNFESQVEQSRKTIFEYRNKKDGLIKNRGFSTVGNSIALVTLSRAYTILKDKKYMETVIEILNFIEKNMIVDKGIFIKYVEKDRSGCGTVDEYAFLSWAYLEIFQATGNDEYLKKAICINKRMLNLFWDVKKNGLYFSSKNAETLIYRCKVYEDREFISGNSIATYVFLKLAEATQKQEYKQLVVKQLSNIIFNIYESPLRYSFYLITLDLMKVKHNVT